jgi:peptidoglycan-N-acetylglucosamine deacetylase
MTLAPLLLAGTGCAAGTYSWAACVPSAQLFGRTIRRTGDPRTIALTFDDGPNPAITPDLLDLLDGHAVRATFFLIGAHVSAVPDLAREIARRGHTIGNHTDTHPALPLLSARRIAEELDRCDEAIQSATGRKPRWMRPPYGFRSPLLSGIVTRRKGSGVVMWSRLARDWKPQPAEPVAMRLRRVRGGDIVLLHDGDHRVTGGDRRHTVQALASWIPRWKDLGLQMVTLDEVSPALAETNQN